MKNRLWDRRLFLWCLGIYGISRTVLYILGVRFVTLFEFMHFMDPKLLEERLAESILYSHAFPPMMNLLAGMGLNLFGTKATTFFHLVFLVLGALLTVSFAYLLKSIGLKNKVVIFVVTLFNLSPASIYFENFFFHTYPSAALLLLSVALFHHGFRSEKFSWWLSCFLTGAFLCYTRSVFHLAWLTGLFVMSLIFAFSQWRRISLAFAFPFLLVLALYLKNLTVFGFFGASSWLGNSLARKTVQRLPDNVRETWIRDGLISPLARKNIFGPPEAFADHFDLSSRWGRPALDDLDRSVGYGNFNHWVFLEVSESNLRDALFTIRKRPGFYFQTVRMASIDFFRPSTRWHPMEPEYSPHAPNRRVLEHYENVYNLILHKFPYRNVGLYVLTPFVALFLVVVLVPRLWRRGSPTLSEEMIIVLALFNTSFVFGVSVLVELGELERFRFMVEPLLWLMVIYFFKVFPWNRLVEGSSALIQRIWGKKR